METNKAQLLLEKFEENAALEKFFFDQADRDSLVQILGEQQNLLPELLREMNLLQVADPLWARLRAAAEARSLQETAVANSLGEMRRELGRLRQCTKRLQDWKQAWRRAVRSNFELGENYA